MRDDYADDFVKHGSTEEGEEEEVGRDAGESGSCDDVHECEDCVNHVWSPVLMNASIRASLHASTSNLASVIFSLVRNNLACLRNHVSSQACSRATMLL